MQDALTSTLTAYFWQGDALRSRSVSGVVLHSLLAVPALPARLTRDCDHEMARLGLAPGDVEALSLPRARLRWPDHRRCVQAVADWAAPLGLAEVLATADMALMACHGARYHHDGAQYGGMAFCNLFLNDTPGLDLHFPHAGEAGQAGLRIPLTRGTVVVFDTAQPHAVIRRGSPGFSATDFAPGSDRTQLFLTWELPITAAAVAHAMGITVDTDPATAAQQTESRVWRNGAPMAVRDNSGQWCRED